MSLWTSSLPVLRRSSCCRHNPFSQRLLCGKRRFKGGLAISWRAKNKKFRGAVVTGASAATGAIVYFTLKYHGQENLRNIFQVDHEKIWNTLSNDVGQRKILKEHNKDIDVLDVFYEVGFEDDWLACPLSDMVSYSRPIEESSAFIKPNIVELLSPWEQASSDDPWVLLHLTKSSNFWVRQVGVACLADQVDWEEYKYRNIAQACDYKTVIALARYPQASDLYFFPQPKLCPAETDVLSEIQDLVSKMPVPGTVKCNIAFYRDLALQKEILFQKDPSSMDFLNQFYALPGEDEKKKEKSLRHCLQALEAYTLEENYASYFVYLNGLAVLQRLHEDSKDEWIQTYILIILNNLSLIPEVGKDFVRTGWIHELRNWSKASHTTISIMADTILANLDRDWISTDLYKNMILLHPTQRNSQPVSADIVLVHGLRGGAVKTWRQRDQGDQKGGDQEYSLCWPKDWLSQEFQATRIISVGYNSNLHQWGEQSPYETERRTLEGRSEELIQHLMKAGIGTRPVIWMGHSMGGLLIKEILHLSSKIASWHGIVEKTKGIIMYSVPHKGSPVVDTMMNAKYILFPSVEVQEMSTYSSKLKDLHEEFITTLSDYCIPCLSFGENIKTDFGRPFPKIMLVPMDSSDPGVGQFISLSANHIETCKPSCKDDPTYLHTLKFLQDILKSLH